MSLFYSRYGMIRLRYLFVSTLGYRVGRLSYVFLDNDRSKSMSQLTMIPLIETS